MSSKIIVSFKLKLAALTPNGKSISTPNRRDSSSMICSELKTHVCTI